MTNYIKKFLNDESGATAIEYGLIAALISVAIIGGATVVGENLQEKFTQIGDALTEANTPAGTE